MFIIEFIEQKEFQELPQRLKGADLHRAITNRDVDEIKRLIRRGVPMEVQNSRGLTPLQVLFEKLYQIHCNWNFWSILCKIGLDYFIYG